MATTKVTEPKDKALAQDIINEGAKAVDQSALKSEVAAMGNQGSNLPPVETQSLAQGHTLAANQQGTSATTNQGHAVKIGTPVHAEDAADILKRENLLKQYGPGYVVARKGGIESVFSRITWDRLGGNKNQDGWREVVETPQEVKDLQKKQV